LTRESAAELNRAAIALGCPANAISHVDTVLDSEGTDRPVERLTVEFVTSPPQSQTLLGLTLEEAKLHTRFLYWRVTRAAKDESGPAAEAGAT
jgi:hypothetical protein